MTVVSGDKLVTAYIALGANLGQPATALSQAVKSLNSLPLTQLHAVSSLYKTAPLDTDAASQTAALGPDYLNAVVGIQTGLTAPGLLEHLQQIEQAAGRQRPYRNAPRTLDLDLLLYGSGSVNSADLTVPHARMFQRAFVLVPLAEIAPGLLSASQLEAVSSQAIERVGPLKHPL